VLLFAVTVLRRVLDVEIIGIPARLRGSRSRPALLTWEIGPVRDTDTTWRQFLHTQASTMLACDFFHVE
jgi:hypothetical protein